ncbi:MAG: hypothetical protein ABFD83_14645 [Armatimonadota bacterium]
MKLISVVLALVIVVSCSALADGVTYDVYDEWNCISAPLVPLNSDPLNVFDGIPIINNLTRFDAQTQGNVGYDDLDPTGFGNVLLGDGLWLLSNDEYTVSYEGVADGIPSGSVMTDICISLPGDSLDGEDVGGYQLIGTPFNHDVPMTVSSPGDNIKITDGTRLLTLKEAADSGWCEAFMTGYDATIGSQFSCGYDLCDREEMEPGYGYWFLTYKDNLIMIIPGS